MDEQRSVNLPAVERYPVLDTVVDTFGVEGFLDHVTAAVAGGRRHLVANHNVNSLSLFQRSAEFRAFFDLADAVFIDGMPVVGLARLLGHPVRREHRIGVLDWIWPLAARAEQQGWHIVHLGGDDTINEGARRLLCERHPQLRLSTINGFFDASKGASENEHVLEQLRALQPDIVLVGMGMPRQEIWLLENLDELPEAVVITVGGIFGYLSGDRPTAPRWLGMIGLEWLFRLATEPRRLWRRYLLEPLSLVVPLASALARRR